MIEYSGRRKLTKRERAWMLELEKVLLAAPPGICCYTIGDRDLTVYDSIAAKAEGIEIHDGQAISAGIALGAVKSACLIDSTTG